MKLISSFPTNRVQSLLVHYKISRCCTLSIPSLQRKLTVCMTYAWDPSESSPWFLGGKGNWRKHTDSGYCCAVCNKELFLWPRNLMSFPSIHLTATVSLKVGQNLSSFTVLDTHSGEELPMLPSVQKHRKLSLVLCKDLDGWDEREVGGRSKREHIMHTHSWFTSLYSRNQHNIVKQLHFNRKETNDK